MQDICLILSDIRSSHNVGSILRTADGFGVKQIIFAGYTPYPLKANDNRLPHEAAKINRAIHKTALGAEFNFCYKYFQDSLRALDDAKKQGYQVAAIEQAEDSVLINDYVPPIKLAIILGNELNGVSMETLRACDVILEIPMSGKKESFNVSISAAIALYALNNNYAK